MRLKRFETAVAVLLTLVAAGFHVVRALHAGALWRDEASSARLAALPSLKEMFASFPLDSFPMLFPLTLRGWVAAAGGSDAALRLFGLIVGLAIVGALWLNARAAGTVPILSVMLIGLHPAFLTYGDSVRGYGLGTLLVLLTFWAFGRLVTADRMDPWRIALAGGLAVASVHVLYHAAALLFGIAVSAAAAGLASRRWRLVWTALGVGLMAALSLLPYAGPLAAAREWDVVLVESLAPGQIAGSLWSTLGQPFPWVAWVWGGLLVWGLVAAVAAWRRDRSAAALFRLLVLPAAGLAQYGLFLAIGYPPRIWYFLPLLALAACWLDGGLAALAPVTGRSRVLIPIAALLAGALLAPAMRRPARMPMTNVDRVARLLEASAAPDDLIVVNPWYLGVSFQRYYRGRTRWTTVPELDDHGLHRYDLFKARMESPVPIDGVLGAVRRTLRSGRRVWLVGAFETVPEGERPDVPMPPPAPGSPTGWSNAPYARSWSLQVGTLLRDRARGRTVRVPGGRFVHPYENLAVHEFKGWRRRKER